MFEEELKGIPALSDEELLAAFEKIRSGDTAAFSDVVTKSQHRVFAAALLFNPEDAAFMDLIQEGNLALMSFLQGRKEAGESFIPDLENAIRDAMKTFLDQETENKKTNEKLRDTLNRMDEITMRIAEEENREATPEEIGKLMNLSESDVRYLMRIALDALNEE